VLGIVGRDGAFADHLALPARNLHLVPNEMRDEVAVFAEPLAAALQIQEQVAIGPTDRVLLVGAGRLGQLIAQTLSLTRCELVVAVRNPGQETLLRQRGIDVIEPAAIPERAMDLVIEATGSADGFELARRAVRPRGTLVLKSTYARTVTVDFSALVVDEVTIVGSRCGPFGKALALLERGLVDPRQLIDSRYELEQALVAFARAAEPGVLKVLLQP
jgi:threonine dehydrogenase-like Zn-dependent dehydrogenase